MEGIVGELLPAPKCGASRNSGYGRWDEWLGYKIVSSICYSENMLYPK